MTLATCRRCSPALGTAPDVVPASPVPPGAAAVAGATAAVDADYHQFYLCDGNRFGVPAVPGPEPWLALATASGLAIRTGVLGGPVQVTVELYRRHPGPPADTAEESIDLVLLVPTGQLRVVSRLHGVHPALPPLTREGPGGYGVRVLAAGRRHRPRCFARTPTERFVVQTWRLGGDGLLG